MIDDLNQYPIQRQWEQQQQTSALTAISIAGVAIAAVGTGVSLYGQAKSSEAQKAAASSNAYVAKMTATAQANSAIYSDELNYKTAMIQSQESHNNANILHNAAKMTTAEGTAQIQALNMQHEQANSAARAAFGASGVTEDSGAPALVQAHNAGIQHIASMDSEFKFNTQAEDQDWQAELQDYQGNLTAATAQQYKYAEDMANWQKSAGIAGAITTQQTADANANAQQIAGYGQAASQLGSSVNSGISTYKTLNS